MCCSLLSYSVMSDSAMPWTVACRAPLSLGFSNTGILEWVAIPFSRDLLKPGMKPRYPALQADSLPSEPPGKPNRYTKEPLKKNQVLFILPYWISPELKQKRTMSESYWVSEHLYIGRHLYVAFIFIINKSQLPLPALRWTKSFVPIPLKASSLFLDSPKNFET